MKQTNLQKALAVWTQADHTQSEFAKVTGIEQSICSRIFTGARGFTRSQRVAVFKSFQKIDLQQGLIFLKADLEDQTPNGIGQYLHFKIEVPTKMRSKKPAKANRVQEARDSLVSKLEANDPGALAVALALHDWHRD